MVDISHALTVEGFMSEVELTYLAELASKCEVVVEVGSWKGRSACALAANCPGIVIAVDTWSGSLETNEVFSAGIFGEFLQNTKPYKNIIPFPVESKRAANMMKFLDIKPDMIFLDGDHNLEGITSDINAWRPILCGKDYLCGHDYGYSGWPDVKLVVDSIVSHFRTVETIWTTEGCL